MKNLIAYFPYFFQPKLLRTYVIYPYLNFICLVMDSSCKNNMLSKQRTNDCQHSSVVATSSPLYFCFPSAVLDHCFAYT